MDVRGVVVRSLAVAGLAFVAQSAALADDTKEQVTYRVTISNLTVGQPFTPPVVAFHNNRAQIFEVGEPAIEGVRQIAENGNNAPLVAALAGDTNVRAFYQGNAPLVPAANPGGAPFDSEVTFEVTTDRSARFLSFVSMLICTNDGFTGLNTVRLPSNSAKTTFLARGYETRTEQNTEDFSDIVPPCQGLIRGEVSEPGTGESNPLLSENGVIIPHIGVIGDNDLSRRTYGWSDPVAKVEVQRVRNSK
ncbi:MAG: spondin domain-containing protein [Pseudomonadota bacterium]